MSLMRHDLADDAVPAEVDGVVGWPDGTMFVNITNPCCGSPYPLAILPSGAEHCAGCLHTLEGYDDAVERALDEDADRWTDYHRDA